MWQGLTKPYMSFWTWLRKQNITKNEFQDVQMLRITKVIKQKVQQTTLYISKAEFTRTHNFYTAYYHKLSDITIQCYVTSTI